MRGQPNIPTHNMISESLAMIDAFAQPPPFRVLNLQKYSTKLGQFLTIGIVTVCLIQAISSFYNTINFSNPNVVVNQQLATETEPIYLGKENFTLSIGFTDVNSNLITDWDRYLNLTIQNCYQLRKTDPLTGQIFVNTTCINYLTEPCTSDHFPSSWQQIGLANRNTSNLICINSSEWDKRLLILQGSPLSNNFQLLAMYVKPCVNSSSYSKCYPTLQIAKKLVSFNQVYYTNDLLVTVDNKVSPLTPIMSLQGTQLLASQSIFFQQETQLNYVQTDDGLITKSQSLRFGTAVLQTVASFTPFNTVYYAFNVIQLSNKSVTYSRSYLKLQEIMGQQGGLWQTLYFIAFVLINPIIVKLMNIELVNRVFQFERKESIMGSRSIFKGKSMVLRSNIVNSDRDYKENMIEPKDSTIRRDLTQNKMINYLKSKKKSLNLNLCNYLKLLFGCKNQEKQQIDFAALKIMNQLDITFIIHKLLEIEKLKQILLSKEQKFLFDYLPKPTIPAELFEAGDQEDIFQSLSQNPIYDLIIQGEKNDMTKLLEAQQAYQFIKHQKQSIIDLRLINQIDPEILTIFDQVFVNQSGEFKDLFKKHKVDNSLNMAQMDELQFKQQIEFRQQDQILESEAIESVNIEEGIQYLK